jgi:hypothetical protein
VLQIGIATRNFRRRKTTENALFSCCKGGINMLKMTFWMTVTAILGAAFGTALALVGYHSRGLHGLLVTGVVLGGIGGGFTQALSGGERYGLSLPTRGDRNGGAKVDPGFIGDMFVGLMAGILGISMCSRTLKTSLFDPSGSTLMDLWFMDFSIAFVSGFLGLRLIKAISTRFMQEARLKEAEHNAEESRLLAARTFGISLYLSGQEALRSGQLDLAEQCFRQDLAQGEGKTIRSLVGLGMVLKRRFKFDEALRTMDEAVANTHEPVAERRAVAYFNRACYKVLARPDSEAEITSAISDLDQAVLLDPSLRKFIGTDEDLKAIQADPRIIILKSDEQSA